MMRRLLAALIALAPVPAWADNGAYPTILANDGAVLSQYVRDNFAVAYRGGNCLLGVFYGTVAPSSSWNCQRWIDTSTTPATAKIWTGSTWVPLSTYLPGNGSVSASMLAPGAAAANLGFTPLAVNGNGSLLKGITPAQIGALAPAQSFSGVGPLIRFTQTATGSSSSGTGTISNLINITSDNKAAVGSPSPVYETGFVVQNINFGGPAASGGRVGLSSQITQTAATSTTNALRDYIADYAYIISKSGDGGDTGTEKGSYYARWTRAALAASAAHVTALTGDEIDLNALSGSSMLYKTGLQITHANGDVAHGSVYDSNIWMFNDNVSQGAAYGILMGRSGFGNGLLPNGTVLKVVSGTIGTGIDLSSVTCAGLCFVSAGFSVNTTGDTFANSVRTSGFAFANIPACSGEVQGKEVFVVDSNTATFHTVLAGGGTNVVKAWCDGRSWRVGG